jgi:pentose-5-phosphate-3-epimerase
MITTPAIFSADVAHPAEEIENFEMEVHHRSHIDTAAENPGFGVQQFITYALHKIRKLEEQITSNRYQAGSKADAGVDCGGHFRWFDAVVDRVAGSSASSDSHANPTDSVLAIGDSRPADDKPGCILTPVHRGFPAVEAGDAAQM